MFRNTQDAETMHDNLNNFKNIFFFLIVKRGRFDFQIFLDTWLNMTRIPASKQLKYTSTCFYFHM